MTTESERLVPRDLPQDDDAAAKSLRDDVSVSWPELTEAQRSWYRVGARAVLEAAGVERLRAELESCRSVNGALNSKLEGEKRVSERLRENLDLARDTLAAIEAQKIALSSDRDEQKTRADRAEEKLKSERTEWSKRLTVLDELRNDLAPEFLQPQEDDYAIPNAVRELFHLWQQQRDAIEKEKARADRAEAVCDLVWSAGIQQAGAESACDRWWRVRGDWFERLEPPRSESGQSPVAELHQRVNECSTLRATVQIANERIDALESDLAKEKARADRAEADGKKHAELLARELRVVHGRVNALEKELTKQYKKVDRLEAAEAALEAADRLRQLPHSKSKRDNYDRARTAVHANKPAPDPSSAERIAIARAADKGRFGWVRDCPPDKPAPDAQHVPIQFGVGDPCARVIALEAELTAKDERIRELEVLYQNWRDRLESFLTRFNYADIGDAENCVARLHERIRVACAELRRMVPIWHSLDVDAELERIARALEGKDSGQPGSAESATRKDAAPASVPSAEAGVFGSAQPGCSSPISLDTLCLIAAQFETTQPQMQPLAATLNGPERNAGPEYAIGLVERTRERIGR